MKKRSGPEEKAFKGEVIGVHGASICCCDAKLSGLAVCARQWRYLNAWRDVGQGIEQHLKRSVMPSLASSIYRRRKSGAPRGK
ncbi:MULTISPECIES: hypothetical protein [unclassified Pseudomonas]|uniref:hypothetical protein n=1 Tax=unclassified Pseudomonas TaxID=196821 RepID=UPI0035C0EF85